MKNKKFFIVFGIIIVIVICIVTIIFINQNNIKDTNLTNITLDNLKINQILDYEMTENYTDSNRYNGNYKYKFEEIVIDVNSDNKINYLFARFDEKDILISINENTDLTTIEQVSNILGNNYKRKTADREQKLSEYIYYDKTNNIKAEFIYSDLDNTLKWMTIQTN